MVEAFHLYGDLTRTQLALAAPFVQKPEEHAVRSKLVLFAQRLGLSVLVTSSKLMGYLLQNEKALRRSFPCRLR